MTHLPSKLCHFKGVFTFLCETETGKGNWFGVETKLLDAAVTAYMRQDCAYLWQKKTRILSN